MKALTSLFGVAFVLTILLIVGAFLSSVNISPTQRGVVLKLRGDDLPPTSIVATNGERGPQAQVLSPGRHWFANIPFLRKVEKHPMITVPRERLLTLIARDGQPLPQGYTYAPEWETLEMLDPLTFLQNGGIKGPQLTTLPPGTYFVHPYLFEFKDEKALSVQAGEVAVIRDLGGPISDKEEGNVNGNPIVPNGYRGIWNTPLPAGLWYIHPVARSPIIVTTTERSFTYQNGVDPKGQKYNEALTIRTKDGFPADVDVRVSLVIRPEMAPYLVALLGDPDKIEFSTQEQDELSRLEYIIVLPEIRSATRNAGETVEALHLVNNRSQFEKDITAQIKPGFEQRYIALNHARIGAIDLTRTEAGQKLVDTQTDKRVAEEQIPTFQHQKKAEEERINLVRATTQAEQETELVRAERLIQINRSKAEAAIEEAKGHAQSTIERAKGDSEAYKLRADVLGQENIAKLELIRLAGENKVVITPQVVTSDSTLLIQKP